MVHYFYRDALYTEAEFYTAGYRAFNYGDGIFESCLLTRRFCPLWKYHRQRMKRGVEVLQMTWPSPGRFGDLELSLQHFLDELATHHPEAQFFRVRINLVRSGKGLYTPEASQCDWWFTGSAYGETPWPSAHTGYRIMPAPGNIHANQGLLAGLKSLNCLPYVMASIYCNNQDADEVWLSNARGQVADAASHALFLIRDNMIITPSVESGAVQSVSAAFIRENLPADFSFHEQVIKPELLQQSEEAFLSNAVRGIVPVSQLDGRTVKTATVQKLMQHYHRVFRQVAGIETMA